MSNESYPPDLTPSGFDIHMVQQWIPDPVNPKSHAINTLEAVYDPEFQNHRTGEQILQRLQDLDGLSSLQPTVDYEQLDQTEQRIYRNAQDLYARVLDAALLENAEWDKHYVETHEPNTKLLNKNGLYEKLDQWTNLPRQTLVITFDCRKFKTINDTLGHPIGDVMIDEVAQLLQHSFRGIDFTQERGKREPDLVARANSDTAAEARVGGDEFVVGVLLDSDRSVEEYLEIFNERIASYMNRLFDKHKDKSIKQLGFGLTIGAAVRKPHESIQDVIHRSDSAQFKAKGQQEEGKLGQVSPILLAED